MRKSFNFLEGLSSVRSGVKLIHRSNCGSVMVWGRFGDLGPGQFAVSDGIMNSLIEIPEGKRL